MPTYAGIEPAPRRFFSRAFATRPACKGAKRAGRNQKIMTSMAMQYDSTICAIDDLLMPMMGESHQELSAQKRTRCTKRRPQLPCWCRAHGSERPVSKDRHRPQLCAKPPHRRLAAQRASASSLPASGALLLGNYRLRGQCWPASLAADGSSAHLAGVRRSRA